MELMETIRQQAERFGTQIVEFEEVSGIKPGVRQGLIEVHTDDGQVLRARPWLSLPAVAQRNWVFLERTSSTAGEYPRLRHVRWPPLQGQGRHHHRRGQLGLQEGLPVLEYANKVTSTEFLPYSRAEQILQDRVKAHEKSSMVFNTKVTEIKGEQTVKGVVAIDRETGEEKWYPADGVFIYVGYSPYTQFVSELLELNKWGISCQTPTCARRYQGSMQWETCVRITGAVECLGWRWHQSGPRYP